jgi:AraC family transcriptional regulator
MEGLCLELLAHAALTASEFRGRPPAWVQRAKELLRDRCTDHLRLAEAAHSLGVHPVHLSRGFRHFLGYTPGEYLTRCRMERAITMLRVTNLPLADTALQAGFFDQSHFTKAFRRHFGVSPYVYRRMMRSDTKADHGSWPS